MVEFLLSQEFAIGFGYVALLAGFGFLLWSVIEAFRKRR